MSAPHIQTAFPQRFPTESSLARMPFTNPTLDRRMSEPVLGAGRPTYAQPPPSQHDTFAYSTASSATIVQSSPLSPRPSSSYSSYGAYTEHQRDSSGASIGSAGLSDPYANPIAAWGSGLKQTDLEADAHLASSPLSPLYAGSAASSDVSVTGLPSPPAQMHPSPSKNNAAVPSGGGAKSQQGVPNQASAGSTPRPGGNSSKTYSFVSLPGNAVKKRPRRRYDEIERLYQCRYVSHPTVILASRAKPRILFAYLPHPTSFRVFILISSIDGVRAFLFAFLPGRYVSQRSGDGLLNRARFPPTVGLIVQRRTAP